MAKRNRRKNRPCDPAEAARRLAEIRSRPDLWGTNDEALGLASNVNVVMTPETRNKAKRVQRFDVFGLLNARKDRDGVPELPTAHLDAVRRLEKDIAILHRTRGAAGTGIRIANTNTAEGFAKARILAGKRISDVSDKTGALSWAILQALCEAPAVVGDLKPPTLVDRDEEGKIICRTSNWRSIVHKATGERNHMAQAALVKMAAANLAGAYQAIDQGERRSA